MNVIPRRTSGFNSTFLSVLVAVALASQLGCEIGKDAGPRPDGNSGEVTVTELAITPQTAEVAVKNGQADPLSFLVMATFSDGTSKDVTSDAGFLALRGDIGHFEDARFLASGNAAGQTLIRANYDGVNVEASVTVHVSVSRNGEGVSEETAAAFATAQPDPTRAPVIVYPSANTLFPQNLGRFETHVTDTSSNDVYELSLKGEYAEVVVVSTKKGATGTSLELTALEWQLLAVSEPAKVIDVTVRGMASDEPTKVGTTSIKISSASEAIRGGIYYWAAVGALPSGIYRHDMGKPDEPAEAFFTTTQTPGGRCVGCHVVSPDGKRMAVTFDGGDGDSTVLNVKKGETTMPIGGNNAWNFASFSPDGAKLATVRQGVVVVRDGGNGEILATMTSPGRVSHPDFSPSGDAIVYTELPSPATGCGFGPEVFDWCFSNGSIVKRSFDPVSNTFGDPVVLAQQGGQNFYYPTWSPDGKWIAFNRSTSDAYDDVSAELMIIAAEGGTPIVMKFANVGAGFTNSWIRWAPFAQVLGEEKEPLFWFTFASKRTFGVKKLDTNEAQIWMAPFFPGRASAGQDPTLPAFRLPFQELTTSNHIAQWTKQILTNE